jgi:hypothetical protein
VCAARDRSGAHNGTANNWLFIKISNGSAASIRQLQNWFLIHDPMDELLDVHPGIQPEGMNGR